MNCVLPVVDYEQAVRRLKSRRVPSRIELVRLPHWLVTFTMDVRGVNRTIHAMIGGHEPIFSRPDWSTMNTEHRDDVELFAPTIDAVEAEQIARAKSDAAVKCELIQYPFWVGYHERRGGRLDFRILDAVTGRPAGPKVKAAFLTALACNDSQMTKSAT